MPFGAFFVDVAMGKSWLTKYGDAVLYEITAPRGGF
jgi:hypothetical protein